MKSYKADILIVDDTPNNLKLLSRILAEHNYKVRSVTSGAMALTVARAACPDLILLDIKMPEMDGYTVCEHLKLADDTHDIPVIFLSALDEAFDKVKAFQVGGIDYVTKPFQLEEVLVRIETQLQLRAARHSLTALNNELEQRVRQRTCQLEQEIAARQKAQDRLLYVALHDDLTNLPNRTLFMQRLQQVLETARQDASYRFAVLFLDCDRFKLVNDSLGHHIGDQLLIALSRRLQSCVPPGSTIARLGGDEFIILLEKLDSTEAATNVADRIQLEMRLPFQLNETEFLTSISIGIALGSKSYTQPEHLLRDADAAMYAAKAQGKACYSLFDEGLHHRVSNRFHLEVQLQQAAEARDFSACFQPIIALATGKLVGFETLIRWQHRDLGAISPSVFVPIAEDSGLIDDIDLWMLRTACQQLATWQQQQLIQLPFRLGINFSARNFMRPHFIHNIDRLLSKFQLDGQLLKLEITERELMSNAQAALAVLAQFQVRNIQVAIDDFGTGYSCLGYLQRFPIDTLKIDRSFVMRLDEPEPNVEIVRAIIAIANSLGMNTVAEGVETELQRDRLIDLGCQDAQGYLFARPMAAEDATLLLQKEL